jgi:hypothetical protein
MRNRGRQTSRGLFVRRGPAFSAYMKSLRPLLALVGIFAIAIQSFVVQTHIHAPLAGASMAAAQSDVLGVSAAVPGGDLYPIHGKFSSSDDASNCRLCQELFYAGRFVAPSTAVLLLPIFFSLLLVVFAHSAMVSTARAYIWRSRAPPAHS